jgi:predicted PurR-regulated permease PerM
MPRLTAPPRPVAITVEERPPFWWLRWVPAALLTVATLYLFYVVGKVAIVPVLASFAIAYVINPVAEGFEGRGLNRPLAALAAIAVVALAIAGFLWFVIPDLWTEAVQASDAILNNLTPENAAKARTYIREWSPLLDQLIGWRVQRFLRSPDSLLLASQSWLAGSLTDFLTTAANALDLLLIPFFVYYILVDFEHWRLSFDDLIPPRFRDC